MEQWDFGGFTFLHVEMGYKREALFLTKDENP